jgi:hypothetical protein
MMRRVIEPSQDQRHLRSVEAIGTNAAAFHRKPQLARRAGVPEASAAKVHANPDEGVLIARQVDVVVA